MSTDDKTLVQSDENTSLNKPQFFCHTRDTQDIAEEPREIFEGIPLLSLVLACHRLEVHLLICQ